MRSVDPARECHARGMSLLEEHVALRLAAFRGLSPFVDGPAAEEAVRTYLSAHHANGEVRAWSFDGKLAAIVAWNFVPDTWFGAPSWNVAVDHRTDVPADRVESWLLDALGPALPGLDAEIDLLLPASYRPAFSALRRLGLGIDSVQLVGEVEVALASLGDSRLSTSLAIEPLDAESLPAVLGLLERTFADEPEHGWFCALPAFLARQRDELEKSLDDANALQLVVKSGQHVVGHVGATIKLDNPFWGPSASLGICLDSSIRRRGVLRPLYRAFLEGLRARGLRVFRGGTSRPEVMHLGHVMRRTLQGLNLRRNVPFPDAHFATWWPSD